MSGTPTLFWKDRALCRCRNSEEAEQNRVEKGSCDDLSLWTPSAGSLPVPHQAALPLAGLGEAALAPPDLLQLLLPPAATSCYPAWSPGLPQPLPGLLLEHSTDWTGSSKNQKALYKSRWFSLLGHFYRLVGILSEDRILGERLKVIIILTGFKVQLLLLWCNDSFVFLLLRPTGEDKVALQNSDQIKFT